MRPPQLPHKGSSTHLRHNVVRDNQADLRRKLPIIQLFQCPPWVQDRNDKVPGPSQDRLPRSRLNSVIVDKEHSRSHNVYYLVPFKALVDTAEIKRHISVKMLFL